MLTTPRLSCYFAKVTVFKLTLTPWSPMKKYPLILCLLSLIGSSALLLRADVALVGTYDENTTQSNSVNVNAAFASGTGAATSANVLTAATFKTNVESAFTNGFGGVLNFDSLFNIDDQVPTTGITSPFGGTFDSGNKSLAISLSLSSGDNVFRQMNLSNRTPISAGNGSTPGGALNTQDETPGALAISFGSITGGDPGEVVTEAGFTFLSRTSRNFGVVTAVATFDNGDTVTSSFLNTANPSTGQFTAGEQDMFFGFSANPGRSISSINLSTENEYQFSIDDLGVVTIPEPSSLLLVMGGMLAGVVSFRRRCGR